MALTPHICIPPPGAQGLGSEGLGAMGCRSGHRPPCCSLGSPLSVQLGGAGGGTACALSLRAQPSPEAPNTNSQPCRQSGAAVALSLSQRQFH